MNRFSHPASLPYSYTEASSCAETGSFGQERGRCIQAYSGVAAKNWSHDHLLPRTHLKEHEYVEEVPTCGPLPQVSARSAASSGECCDCMMRF